MCSTLYELLLSYHSFHSFQVIKAMSNIVYLHVYNRLFHGVLACTCEVFSLDSDENEPLNFHI